MENPKILRKKLTIICTAAIVGTALFDLMLVMLNLAYRWFRGTPTGDVVTGLSFLLAIPSAAISSIVGYKGGLLNGYVVNGVIGAVIFGLGAAIWQFCIKDNEQD